MRTFGWAAVLGEVMAVITVLLVLPSALPDQEPPAASATADDRTPEPRRRAAPSEQPATGLRP
jgi:predicted RND superfamily exporter protein